MFSTNEKNCLMMRINDRGLRKILASLDFVGTKSVRMRSYKAHHNL